MYTMETLSEINQIFISEYYKLLKEDVDTVNICVERIEKSRTSERPMPGDIIRYTDELGYYHPHAYIEKVWDDQLTIAESAGVYCYPDDEKENGFCASVSAGGPFHNILLEKVVFTGEKERKKFWHFGHCGYRANGGIYFEATVNVWECNLNKELYSTKTHDKHYVSYNAKKDYQFTSDTYKAWKNEKDFQAWLRTFRGVVELGNWKNQLIVWTYKNIEHHCSPKEYEDLNIPEDTFLMNARIRRCKRIYDDKNYIVHTYYVWYWDEPEKDFYECVAEQNKIIDSYTGWTNKDNAFAREELKSGKIYPVNLKLED